MPKTPAPAPEPAEKPRIGTRQLVHLAYILREDRAKLDAQIAEVEAAIIERGPGKHSSDNPDQVITVVAGASPSPRSSVASLLCRLRSRGSFFARVLPAASLGIAAAAAPAAGSLLSSR